FKELLGRVVRLDGDTLLLPCRPYGHVPCATAPAPQAGRYRVRASVSAVNTGGKPLPVLLSCRDMYGRDDNDVRGVLDAPAGKVRVIEGEFDLLARQVIVFTGWSLPDVRELTAKLRGQALEKYDGPALAVDWVEITGPLDPWPTTGYQCFFEGVPL